MSARYNRSRARGADQLRRRMRHAGSRVAAAWVLPFMREAHRAVGKLKVEARAQADDEVVNCEVNISGEERTDPLLIE